MLSSIGGWTGTVIAAVPTVVFVVVDSVAGLRAAIGAAVGSALLLALYRLARRQSVQQALSGLLGVLIASLIAGRTGHAKGYFLYGIWTSFLYGGAFTLSILVRRPVVGWVWEFLDPTPRVDARPWYRTRGLLAAYAAATSVGALIFFARGVVQLTLFDHNQTGWLAFARIAMGYPLYIAAIGFGFLVVNRARRRLRTLDSVDSLDDGSAQSAQPTQTD